MEEAEKQIPTKTQKRKRSRQRQAQRQSEAEIQSKAESAAPYDEFMAAASSGELGILQQALAKTAPRDLELRDEHGYTAFLLACRNGHAECAWFLIESGCDTEAEADVDGLPQSAWDLASSPKHTAVLRVLCAVKAATLAQRMRQQLDTATSSEESAVQLVAEVNRLLSTAKELGLQVSDADATADAGTMQIFVKGQHGTMVVVECAELNTVSTLRQKITEKTRIPAADYFLCSGDRALRDGLMTLVEVGLVDDGSYKEVQLVVKGCGGAGQAAGEGQQQPAQLPQQASATQIAQMMFQ